MMKKEQLTQDEFIDMCKRMVVEYYNRYVQMQADWYMEDNSTIDISNVTIIEKTISTDNIMDALLKVDIDPWLQYKVIYNPNNKNKKDEPDIVSYIIYT